LKLYTSDAAANSAKRLGSSNHREITTTAGGLSLLFPASLS